LYFHPSREKLSIEIGLENISPEMSAENIILFLDTLFKEAKEDIR